MSNDEFPEWFTQRHPYPSEEGIDSLFRYQRILSSDIKQIENQDERDKQLDAAIQRLRYLLVDGYLYHSKPAQFNDPFECKPHFQWPSRPSDASAMRQHLEKVARNNGYTRKQAKKFVSSVMRNPNRTEPFLQDAAIQTYGEVRLCSFTTSKSDLLFWAYYGDSHKGMCIEFSTERVPINGAMKVHYQDSYPEIYVPSPDGVASLEPALTKSRVWEKEQEFRTYFMAKAVTQLPNDGQGLKLHKTSIKAIYFGVQVDPDDRQLILDMVKEGPFNPFLFQCQLSTGEFKLDFEQL